MLARLRDPNAPARTGPAADLDALETALLRVRGDTDPEQRGRRLRAVVALATYLVDEDIDVDPCFVPVLRRHAAQLRADALALLEERS